ncbi:MAG: hypothetical protein R3E53_21210 [Myxococcota bacterium]
MEYAGTSRLIFRATIGIRNPGFAVFFFAVAVLIRPDPAFSSTVPIDCNTSPFGRAPLNDLEIDVDVDATSARGAHATWIFDGPGYGERFDDEAGRGQTADTGWSDVDFDVVSIDLDGDGRKDSVAAYLQHLQPELKPVLRHRPAPAGAPSRTGPTGASGRRTWPSRADVCSAAPASRKTWPACHRRRRTGRLNLILSGGDSLDPGTTC